MLPSLLSIQAFEAAARLGGFAAAARELGTSAASVSYHVRQLERQVGAPLFRRRAQGVALTEAGRVVAAEATAAFAALRGSFARAVEADQLRLCVSALPTFASAWLVPRLGDFRASHPEISIRIDTSVNLRDLVDGEADMAIRNGHGRWPGLHSVRLLPALFTPLCAPGVAGAGTLQELTSTEIPLLGRRDWWALWLRASGTAWRPGPERFATNLTTEHLDIAAAVAGQGIAIGSPILFQDEIEAGRLATPQDLVVGDGRAFYVTYPQARRGHLKVEAFAKWIGAMADETMRRATRYVRSAVILEPTGTDELPAE